MESLTEHVLAPGATALALRGRIERWLRAADGELRQDGDRLLADALREAVELAAEELRVEDEARCEAADRAESRAQHLDALFEQVPVALLVTDGDGHVLEANRHTLQLLGEDGQPLVGRLLVRHVVLEDRRAFRMALTSLGVSPGERELPLRMRSLLGWELDVVATVRAAAPANGGRPLLYWALREDRRPTAVELL